MSAGASQRRYLSLALPRLPTDLVERRMSPEARACPRAVVAMEKSALRLIAVNTAAAALGLEPGLALADARARHPDLAVSEAEPDAAARMLEHLADACERYTPLIGLDGADGLVLDVTGCAHLFGGEEGLVRDLLRRVAIAGFAGQAALAATRGAAFALARFAAGRGGAVVPPGEDLAVLLGPLPLEALRLGGAEVEALARLGFRRVGDLYGKPRAPLAARFGAGLLRRLDEALGHAPAAMDYRFPAPVFCAERNLPEPVERVEDVLGLAAHLATTLAEAMERHGMGARRLDLVLFRVDGKVTRLGIGTSRPLRDPLVVRRLFAEKVAALSSLDPGFGFELVRLAVREAAPLSAHQEGFGAGDEGAGALDELVDRLTTRFGAARVRRLVLADRHVPEEAAGDVPAQTAGGWAQAAVALEALEPPGAAGVGPVGDDAEGARVGGLLSGLPRDLPPGGPRLPSRLEAVGARGRDGGAALDWRSADGAMSQAPGFLPASAFRASQLLPASGRGGAVVTQEPAATAWTTPASPATLSLSWGSEPVPVEPAPTGNGGGLPPIAPRKPVPAVSGELAPVENKEGLPLATAGNLAPGMEPPAEPSAAPSPLGEEILQGAAQEEPAPGGKRNSLLPSAAGDARLGMTSPSEPSEASFRMQGRAGGPEVGELVPARSGGRLPLSAAGSAAPKAESSSAPPDLLSRLRGKALNGAAQERPEPAGNGGGLLSTAAGHDAPGMGLSSEPCEAFLCTPGRERAPEVGETGPAGNRDSLPLSAAGSAASEVGASSKPSEFLSPPRREVLREATQEKPASAGNRGGLLPSAAESSALGMTSPSEPSEASFRTQGRAEVGELVPAGHGDDLPLISARSCAPGMELPSEPSELLSRQRGRGLAPAERDVSLFPPECRLPPSAAGGLPLCAEGSASDGGGQSPLSLAGAGWEEAGPLAAGGRGPGRRDGAPTGRRDGWMGGRAVLRVDDEADLAGPARPLRLLDKPEPVEAVAEVPDGPPIRFRWRRVSHVVARAEGPERIAAEWWRSGAEPPARDYFRVETAAGHRFWLFRAGLYGEGGKPAWFIHGLFG